MLFDTLRRSLLASALALLGLALFAAPHGAQAQNTHMVTNTNDSGSGSLRAAITSANDGSGTPADRIEFDIPGSASPASPHVIQPQSALPNITDPVTIDGASEPDYSGNPVVEIDGSSAGTGVDGLSLDAPDNTFRGLAVINFEGAGINTRLVTSVRNTVVGCHLGVRADGTTAAGNARGVAVSGDDQIGGTGTNEGNIVGGNDRTGISLTRNSTVEGNYVGTNPTGDDLGNGRRGIAMTADDNTIGGTASGAENVIGFNEREGIGVFGNGNIVQGNYIGSNVAGNDLGNSSGGVHLGSGASNNTIGGPSTGAPSSYSNTIAHNSGAGVLIQGSSSTGNVVRGNAVYANTGLGIDLADDGLSANDASDSDDGVNRLQNFPEIQSAGYDPGTGEVTVTYLVPSDPGASGNGASAYPLTVDFYKAGAADEEGAAHLGTDTYSSASSSSTPNDYGGCGAPPCAVTTTLTPPSGVSLSRSDDVVATATDNTGNTSEFTGTSQQLPVELAGGGLQAKATGDGSARLSWKTLSEENNDRFEVERQREDASSFGWGHVKTIKTKAEGGTSTEAIRYGFTDADLPFEVQKLTYRLVQYDRDDTREVLAEQSVEVGAPQEFALRGVFPNPVRSKATVRYALPSERAVTVAVYDALGRKVRTLVAGEEQRGRQKTTFTAEGLASGVYFVRMRAGDYAASRKVVLVR